MMVVQRNSCYAILGLPCEATFPRPAGRGKVYKPVLRMGGTGILLAAYWGWKQTN